MIGKRLEVVENERPFKVNVVQPEEDRSKLGYVPQIVFFDNEETWDFSDGRDKAPQIPPSLEASIRDTAKLKEGLRKDTQVHHVYLRADCPIKLSEEQIERDFNRYVAVNGGLITTSLLGSYILGEAEKVDKSRSSFLRFLKRLSPLMVVAGAGGIGLLNMLVRMPMTSDEMALIMTTRASVSSMRALVMMHDMHSKFPSDRSVPVTAVSASQFDGLERVAGMNVETAKRLLLGEHLDVLAFSAKKAGGARELFKGSGSGKDEYGREIEYIGVPFADEAFLVELEQKLKDVVPIPGNPANPYEKHA